MSVNPLAPSWLVHPDDADALPAAVWPASATRDESGAVELGGVTATALAEQYGTPLYVIDEADARARAAGIRAAFTREFGAIGADVHVYYAGKAFLSIEAARWMADEGLRIDVCSGGELAVVLAAGVDPARLGFHGNNKSDAELDRAVEVGLGAVVIDSADEVDRVARAAERHGRVQAVRLRINSGVHASTHDYLATAREDQKFGVPLADAATVVERIRAAQHLRFLGLHSHIGSQIFATEGFAEAAERLLQVHAELLAGGEVPELNLGGGFGIAYTSADEPAPVERIAAELARMVGGVCDRLGIPVPDIAIEPGRAVIGPAGVTLYRAGAIKDVLVGASDEAGPQPDLVSEPDPVGSAHRIETGAVRRYVSVDGGMSDNLRTALYAAEYSVRLAGRRSAVDPVLVRVAGKHCESGDIVVQHDYLPGDVRAGDLLAVPATGAYCFSLASNYNYLGRPAVVAVRDGAARVLIRRETDDDLLRRDTGRADTGVNR